MSLRTTWGYTVDNVDSLPNILDETGYENYTSGKYSQDGRTQANLSAASAAIRNYCGWHVYPSLACTFSTNFYDGRVVEARSSIMVQLPATYVTAVSSVVIDGEELSNYVLEPDGILRVYNVRRCYNPWASIVIGYTAGITDSMAAAIQELTAHRVTHALASSNGVQSEAAGGVSITYNATWTNNSRATALADDNKEVLAPYRLKGVF
jgi:hypothetical protein